MTLLPGDTSCSLGCLTITVSSCSPETRTRAANCSFWNAKIYSAIWKYSNVLHPPLYLVPHETTASYLKQWVLLLPDSVRICWILGKYIVLRPCFPLAGKLAHCRLLLPLTTEAFRLLFARLRCYLLHLSDLDSLTLGTGRSRRHRHVLLIVKVILLCVGAYRSLQTKYINLSCSKKTRE